MQQTALKKYAMDQMKECDTPFFLFDLDKISSNISKIKKELNPDQLFFALKSNSLKPVLETIAGQGCNFEANNVPELDKALAAGVTPADIINSSPIASAFDVREMYMRGVDCFTFDSKDQVRNLKTNAPGAKVVLRLASTNTGSKFNLSRNLGAESKSSADLLHYAAGKGLRIHGLTFHVGSQCYTPSNWNTGIVQCAKLFRQFSELRILNVGGGFPIQYETSIPNLRTITETVHRGINEHFVRKPLLYTEPGRFIVGDCALACASVINIKHGNDLSRAVVDLSVFGGLLEIIENGDSFQYPIKTAGIGDTRSYRIIGATCAGTDVIAEKIQLKTQRSRYGQVYSYFL